MPTEPLEHGVGEVPAEAGRQPGEGVPAGEHAVAGAHQGPAQRAGPEQLLPQQRRAGEPAPKRRRAFQERLRLMVL